uniref:Putative trypsin/chemotrypsin-like S1/S6 peptidase n=1 Tax=Hottentotta judaicus TaxID=6863 RepID=F1CIW1_HOTJU|nr:putative trypsin/chemotrypsin-like S1/S6 peptidase [Hottentotta judaicus]
MTLDNDIAIVEFIPVPLGRNLKAAILPPQDAELSPGTVCTVVGWGRTSYEGQRSPILQQVDVPITSRKECQKNLFHIITPNMLCAGGIEGKDACLGDSGGSLLVRVENHYVSCGVVSFGKNCALPNISGIYTDLSRYTDWIYEKTRNAGCRPRIFDKENYPH